MKMDNLGRFATMFGMEINDIRADSRKNEFGTFVY